VCVTQVNMGVCVVLNTNPPRSFIYTKPSLTAGDGEGLGEGEGEGEGCGLGDGCMSIKTRSVYKCEALARASNAQSRSVWLFGERV
jgi:hypothetical protein